MKERGNIWLRLLDRYAGIPALLCLSAFKGKGEEKPVKRVLVIKLGTIGDTLLLMPVLKSMKNATGASIDVVASRNNEEVLRKYPFIGELKVFELSRALKSPGYFKSFVKGLNKKRYDLIIDFEPWPRVSALLSFFIKGGRKAGFKTRGQYRHYAYSVSALHSPDAHETDNYISLLKAAGIKAGEEKAGFPLSKKDDSFVDEFLRKNRIDSKNLIIFHPWSSGYKGRFKEWDLERFAQLARSLVEKGYTVGVTGVRGDAERAFALEKAYPGRVISFCGSFNLGQSACLIKKSRVLVTVNTGIMHLGAALDHPMVLLNGPAGNLRWGPRGTDKAFTIEAKKDCAPCLDLGFEYRCNDGECMNTITVEEVLAKVEEALGR